MSADGDRAGPRSASARGARRRQRACAFGADSREQVDAFYQAALAAGGTDNGPPGLRPHYHKDYYGAFVLDPDGNKIEAAYRGPDAEEA